MNQGDGTNAQTELGLAVAAFAPHALCARLDTALMIEATYRRLSRETDAVRRHAPNVAATEPEAYDNVGLVDRTRVCHTSLMWASLLKTDRQSAPSTNLLRTVRIG